MSATGGIAHDIYNYMLSTLFYGGGVAESITIVTAGVAYKCAENTNRSIPALTILAPTTNTGNVYVNFGGQAGGFPLVPGASITLRWKNPVLSRLTVSGSSAGDIVQVIG